MGKQLADTKGRPVVVVTGIGVVTSLGQGKTDNWSALTAGKSGIKSITRFPTDGLRTTVAGTVDFLNVEPYSAFELSRIMALKSAREAIGQSDIGTTTHFPGPLFISTCPAEFEWTDLRQIYDNAATKNSVLTGYQRMLGVARKGNFRELSAHVEFARIPEWIAETLGTTGQPISVCTACASGATAIQLGIEAIRRGETEAALCIGTDGTVHVEAVIRLSLLCALASQNDPPEKAMKPFSKDRSGFVMAEGSGALVLESYEAAKARGATILGVVRGCGEKADDYHRTRSKPDGTAIIGAIRNALDDADVTPGQIDYVNAHGTSTPENDKMEYLSLKNVLGEHLETIPVSSNKSMIGHTLLAAGTIEAAISLMTIQTGTVLPTINYHNPDPEIPLDVVPNKKRNIPVETVLSNSFGFGGQNVCLTISAEPA